MIAKAIAESKAAYENEQNVAKMQEEQINAERIRDQQKMKELAEQKAKLERDKREQLAASKAAEEREALAQKEA